MFNTPARELTERVAAAKRELRLSRQLDRFECQLDDIGYVRQERAETEVLFKLLAHRYERRSVMLTSNLVFSQWQIIFPDKMTAAAVDRVVHHSVILELGIPGYRAKQARQQHGAPLARPASGEHRSHVPPLGGQFTGPLRRLLAQRRFAAARRGTLCAGRRGLLPRRRALGPQPSRVPLRVTRARFQLAAARVARLELSGEPVGQGRSLLTGLVQFAADPLQRGALADQAFFG